MKDIRSNTRETLTGTIVYLNDSVGSKSESVAPFLYRGRGADPLSVYFIGDNPFENNRLAEYDGRRVELSGVMGERKFVVDDIKAI